MDSAFDETAGNPVHAVAGETSIDPKAVRAATKKTQSAFAEAYDLPLTTVRDWEQGRLHPDCGSVTLLKMIQADPLAVERFVDKIR